MARYLDEIKFNEAKSKLHSQENGIVQIDENSKYFLVKISEAPHTDSQFKKICYYVISEQSKIGSGCNGSVYNLYKITEAYEVRLLKFLLMKLSRGVHLIEHKGEGWIASQQYPIPVKYFPLKQYDFVMPDNKSIISILRRHDGNNLYACHSTILKLPFHKKANLALQVVTELYRLHEKFGILHRDIKPDNYVLSEKKIKNGHRFYSLSLIDFGLGETLDAEGKISVYAADLAQYLHLAPEHDLAGADKTMLTAQTDIYMMVSILCYIFTDKEKYDLYKTKKIIADYLNSGYLTEKDIEKNYSILQNTTYDIFLGGLPNEQLWRCVRLFLFKMQSVNADERPTIHIVIEFFRVLYQFSLTHLEFNNSLNPPSVKKRLVNIPQIEFRAICDKYKAKLDYCIQQLLSLISIDWPFELWQDFLCELPEEEDKSMARSKAQRAYLYVTLSEKKSIQRLASHPRLAEVLELLTDAVGSIRYKDLKLYANQKILRGELLRHFINVKLDLESSDSPVTLTTIHYALEKEYAHYVLCPVYFKDKSIKLPHETSQLRGLIAALRHDLTELNDNSYLRPFIRSTIKTVQDEILAQFKQRYNTAPMWFSFFYRGKFDQCNTLDEAEGLASSDSTAMKILTATT